MCGINGVYYTAETDRAQTYNIITAMNGCIVHRGPDDEGLYVDNHAALGMRRLSIIDLSTGHQPIFNEDGTKLIVFNGEIYNYRQLRKTLEEKGHSFKTKSDTETILHAYEEYGEKCPAHLEGMFAFAIYDLKLQEIYIARDRAGEKPLYYFRDSERFLFCSELKSILRIIGDRRINLDALNQFLSLTYIPAPLTIFDDIYKLKAGCYLKFSKSGLSTGDYWAIQFHEDQSAPDYETSQKKLREYLFDSVQKMMISDVPLGAFLSGGIDSSIIVGIMSRLSARPVETFTIGFKSREYDESDRAEAVSHFNKTSHHLHYLDFNDALEHLNTITKSMDEPFADSSAIPTYFVSHYASQYVKVVLTGDAGDELFGGYSKYLIDYYSRLYSHVPVFIRKGVFEPLFGLIPDKSALTRKIKKVINNTSTDIFEKRKSLMLLGFNENKRKELLTSEYHRCNSLEMIRKIRDEAETIDEINKTLYTDYKIVLEGDMLFKVDRMSMLNSLETRVPLLDPGIVQLAFSMPSEYKIHGKIQKYILKDTFKDLLPEGLIKKSKRGFAVPIGEWLKGPLKKELDALLNKDLILSQGIFDHKVIHNLLEEHMSNRSNNYSQIWSLYIFQKWFSQYYRI